MTDCWLTGIQWVNTCQISNSTKKKRENLPEIERPSVVVSRRLISTTTETARNKRKDRHTHRHTHTHTPGRNGNMSNIFSLELRNFPQKWNPRERNEEKWWQLDAGTCANDDTGDEMAEELSLHRAPVQLYDGTAVGAPLPWARENKPRPPPFYEWTRPGEGARVPLTSSGRGGRRP